jgi:pseudaminic acid synthase
MIINGRNIGPSHPPYMVAEMSANHNGSIENAFRIIDMAKAAGADAVKMQTYRPDTITIDCEHEDFKISEGLWKGRSLYDLYDWAHTPWDWHKPLFQYAREAGITIFSTPFDASAVDLLEELSAPAYKIASFELTDFKLIEYVASTKKPMIMSTGMANFSEIADAVEVARNGGCSELALLHCVSAYPAPVKECNLSVIADLAQKFDVVVGLSDHSMENMVAVSGIAIGASIIEKHFTLDKKGGGPDDSFSLEPSDLQRLVELGKIAWEARGVVSYNRQESEKPNLKFRRSLYFVKSLKAGEVITSAHVRCIRPGFGLNPKHFDDIIGCTAAVEIEIGTAVAWNHVKKQDC